jgi:hypothetical protein
MSKWTWLLVVAAALCVALNRVAKLAPTRRVVRPHAVGYLDQWGKRSAGLAWGIVAIPDSGWQPGDTLVLLTVNAKLEVRP